MIHLLKTMNGDEYEISQKTRDIIAKVLISDKSERPEYIEIESAGAIIKTASITSIVRFKHEPERLPTREEEIEEFNKRWVPPFPVKEGK